MTLVNVKTAPTVAIAGQVGRMRMISSILRSSLCDDTKMLFIFLLDNLNKSFSHHLMKISLNQSHWLEKICREKLRDVNVFHHETNLCKHKPVETYILIDPKKWYLKY